MIPCILLGEVLQRYFYALVDFSTYAKKHQQAFLAPLLGNVVILVFEPSLPVYPLFLPFFSF
jgi:type IV secretory pathway VirB6-like protein